MPELIIDFYSSTSIIDISYLIITFFYLIKCYRKGFVLSVLSMAKWLLAYILTLLFFPKIKPYFKDIIDSEYILDVVLGISIIVVCSVVSKSISWFTLLGASGNIAWGGFCISSKGLDTSV